MAKIKYVWRIVDNHDCFDRWVSGTKESDFKLTPRFKHWYFKTREMAEAAALPVVQKRHEAFVDDTIDLVNDKSEGTQFDKDEKRWWRKRPPLNIYRTKTRTTYLVGDPFWSDRDRRGYNYGCIERVKVLLDGPEVTPPETVYIHVVDGSIDQVTVPPKLRLVTIDKTKISECQRLERGSKKGPLVKVTFTGKTIKADSIPDGTKVVVFHCETYQGREYSRVKRTQELFPKSGSST